MSCGASPVLITWNAAEVDESGAAPPRSTMNTTGPAPPTRCRYVPATFASSNCFGEIHGCVPDQARYATVVVPASATTTSAVASAGPAVRPWRTMRMPSPTIPAAARIGMPRSNARNRWAGTDAPTASRITPATAVSAHSRPSQAPRDGADPLRRCPDSRSGRPRRPGHTKAAPLAASTPVKGNTYRGTSRESFSTNVLLGRRGGFGSLPTSVSSPMPPRIAEPPTIVASRPEGVANGRREARHVRTEAGSATAATAMRTAPNSATKIQCVSTPAVRSTIAPAVAVSPPDAMLAVDAAVPTEACHPGDAAATTATAAADMQSAATMRLSL